MRKYYYLLVLLALYVAILIGLYSLASPTAQLWTTLHKMLVMQHATQLLYLISLLFGVLIIYILIRIVTPSAFIRIVPIANGKIYLIGKNIQMGNTDKPLLFFDVPVMIPYNSFLSPRKSLISHLSKPLASIQTNQARLLARYSVSSTLGLHRKRIYLYILPLEKEEDVQPGGTFVSISQIPETKCNPLLKIEKNYLKMAADVWKQYGTPHL